MTTSPSRITIAATLAALVLLGTISCGTSNPQKSADTGSGSYDVIVRNAKVVDGTGNPWFYGDVGIRGDRIAAITPAGMLAAATAPRVIDAHRQLVAAPGFIDIQAQSNDALLFGDSRVVSMVTQGITTMILGEGTTPAPDNDKVVPTLGVPDSIGKMYLQKFSGAHGFGAWLDAMHQHKTSVNVGSFLGAATVRAYAKGAALGDATPAELDTMRRVVKDAMLDGAFGVASALQYPPGEYANTLELTEEAKAMAPLGGVYISHIRSESDRLLEAVDEAIKIGRDGGVPVEIYHLKAAGVHNWPKAPLVIAKIDSARAAGQDVGADQYLYVAGQNNLSSCIPPWAHADNKLLERLKDPKLRPRLKQGMMNDSSWESSCRNATPAGVMVVGFKKPENKRFEGKRLPEIAKMMSTDWADAVMDLTVSENNGLDEVIFLASEPNIALQIKQPWMKFGTDAEGLDPDSAKYVVHPRSYGNYPRLLGRYVRELHVLTLEDAVRKASSAVAERLSIRDRGVLDVGKKADMVVFDPATIIDNATYDKPHQLSVGVQSVFVNGVEVLRDGKHTGAKPGDVVRGPGWRVTPE